MIVVIVSVMIVVIVCSALLLVSFLSREAAACRSCQSTMTSRMRRASLETLERIVKDATASQAEAARDRRLSLTMMNCIWARNTDVETTEAVQGVITGTIPSWLRGSLYRVGPGIIQVGDACYNHPFDMLAVVHRYTIGPEETACTYRNKIIDSKSRERAGGGGVTSRAAVAAAAAAARRADTLAEDIETNDDDNENANRRATAGRSGSASSIGSESGSEILRAKLHRLAGLFGGKSRGGGGGGGGGFGGGGGVSDNCIDNVCFFGDDLYILSDIPHMLKIHPGTLDTLGHFDLEECLPIRYATSHPHVEANGTVWNVGVAEEDARKRTTAHYAILRFTKSNPQWSGTMILENAEVVALIPSRHKHSPSFFHSFGVTEQYVVFVEQPLYVEDDWRHNGRNNVNELVSSGLKWRKTEMVYIYLVEKDTGNILPTVYAAEPFFFFHVINAYQTTDNQDIVLTILAYKDAEILSDLRFSHIERTDHVPAAKPIRITLPLHTNMGSGRVVVRKELVVSAETTMEFPRINYLVCGKFNQYFYALGNEYLHPSKVLKVDVVSGDVVSWRDPGHFVSEPIFVPRSKKGEELAEDDGVLIFTLLSASSLTSVQLVILDAIDMVEMARITFRAHGTVTEGFHGIFVRDGDTIHRY